jgi:hypothetical protein
LGKAIEEEIPTAARFDQFIFKALLGEEPRL